MKHSSPFLAAALLGLAGPAMAGNTQPAPADPVVETPAPVSSVDWTGFYAGGQLGYADINSNISGDDDGLIFGFTGGYDYDLGNVVVGAGVDYDFTDLNVAGGGIDLESIFRAKLRGGVKLGDGLLYGTGGYALADTNRLGDEDGYFIGAGYETMVTDSFSLGGELLYHEFDNFNGTNADIDATTVQLRGLFRF